MLAGLSSGLSSWRLLSEEQIKKIHNRSIDILEQIGVEVKSRQAREILSANGCRVDKSRVYYSAPLVEKLVKIRTEPVTIHSRSGKTVTPGDDKVLFHNGGATTTVIDAVSGERRQAQLSDAGRLVKLMDALEHIHGITPIVYPQDVPQELAMLYAVKEIITGSEKPVLGPGVNTLEEARLLHSLFLILAEDGAELREKPKYSIGFSPKSPLTLPENETDAVLWSAGRGVPVGILPCPIAGMTAPLPILAALTQQNAEMLAVLVLLRLVDSGISLTYSARLMYPDLYHGTISGGPEAPLVGAAAVQLADYYGLVSNVYGAGTTSYLADFQTGMEKMLGMIVPAMAGASWLSGAGALGETDTMSYEQLVLDNEMFDFLFHIFGDLQDDEEDLGFAVISDVMAGRDQFISHAGTVNFLRSSEIWSRMKRTLNTVDYSNWSQQGSRSMGSQARKEVERILQEHEVSPLSSEVLQDLEAVILEAENKLSTG